jgi:hypothetical protein
MITYLLVEGQKIALDDPYFTPVEGMSIYIGDKHYTAHIKTRVRVQGQNGDIEQELICES